MDDLISRQAAIDAINHICPIDTEYDCTLLDRVDVRCVLSDLPSVQPEPDGIPLDWIEKHLEWLDSCDNDLAQLAIVSIRRMVELWKIDRT